MNSQQQTLSGATLKLPSWRPQGIPLDEPERNAYRQLCIQAVFSVWANERRPAHLSEIYQFVRAKIKEKIADREWPFAPYRGKRTVDRRVNEAASPAFYEDGIPKIVAVTSGIYQPNPVLFETSGRLAGSSLACQFLKAGQTGWASGTRKSLAEVGVGQRCCAPPATSPPYRGE